VAAAHLVQQLQAVHGLHAQVGDDEVEDVVFQRNERARAAIDAGDAVARHLEREAHRVAQRGIVLDDEDVEGFDHGVPFPAVAPAAASGTVRMNSAPCSGAERSVMSPPWARATPSAIAKPRPVPSARVVKKGSNKRSCSSGAMPRPLSRTMKRTARTPMPLSAASRRAT